jgi:hypothetical protein
MEAAGARAEGEKNGGRWSWGLIEGGLAWGSRRRQGRGGNDTEQWVAGGGGDPRAAWEQRRDRGKEMGDMQVPMDILFENKIKLQFKLIHSKH